MTQTTEELCLDLLGGLRDEGLHPTDAAFAVVQTLAALALVGEGKADAQDPGRLPDVIDRARSQWRPRTSVPSPVSPFDRLLKLDRLSPRAQTRLLDRARDLAFERPSPLLYTDGLLELCLALARGGDRLGEFVTLSPQLTETLIGVLGATKGETAWCAFSGAAEAALRLGAIGVQVRLDLPSGVAEFWSAVAAACDCDVTVNAAAPLQMLAEDPHAAGLDESRPFDVALVVPLFGVKLGALHRLAGASESLGVGLAARFGRRAAAVAPGSVLFRTTSADQAFKAGLIDRYGLTAVAALPHGFLQPHTNIASGLLFFRRGAQGGPLLMVDPSVEGADIKAAADHIVTALRQPGETAWSRFVDMRELADHGFNLSPERYVLPPSTRRLHALLDKGPTAPLGDLVEILRPQLVVGLRDQGEGPGLREISVGDIGDFGLVERPEKRVEPNDDQFGRISKAVVYPDDVLLVAKGSVGKVAFIADAGEDWIASQSFVILRPRRFGPLADAAYLYGYLASEIGQSLIQTFRSGTSVPMLQMADIKSFPVLLPPPDQQSGIGHEVRALFDLQRQIRYLREEGERRMKRMWPADRL